MENKKFWTSEEVAKILGLTRRRILQAREDQKLGTNFGRFWLFTAEDIKKIEDRKGQVGKNFDVDHLFNQEILD